MRDYDDDPVMPFELGTLEFPKTTFGKLKTRLRRAYNERLESQHAVALEVYEKLIKKHKRGGDWRQEAINLMTGTRPMSFAEQVEIQGTSDPKLWDEKIAAQRVPVNLDPEGWIMTALFEGDTSGKPCKPKKKNFASRTSAWFNRGCVLNLGAASLTLPGGEFTWARWTATASSLTELDRTREHPVAKALFETAEKVKRWQGGGGRIIRCDGEYVKQQFGKRG